jgi:hypothetical protein
MLGSLNAFRALAGGWTGCDASTWSWAEGDAGLDARRLARIDSSTVTLDSGEDGRANADAVRTVADLSDNAISGLDN